jgi:lipoprotein-anchoring transpeptidase ErfK/SrfK
LAGILLLAAAYLAARADEPSAPAAAAPVNEAAENQHPESRRDPEIPPPVTERGTAEPNHDTNKAAGAGAVEAGRRLSPLELQVELHRRGFSCGSIDGVAGAQTVAALRAFQRGAGIAETGVVDAATRTHLTLSAPALSEHTFSPTELGTLRPVPKTWLEKSQAPQLAYSSALEFVAERYHASPNLIRRLNPTVNWMAVLPGTRVMVPAVTDVTLEGEPAEIVITLGARELEVIDETSRVIGHFPVSIAHHVEKRPVGELHVQMIILDPDYTFDPEVFTESAEAKALGRRLVIPPGPNNPVGLAWIALDRPGYGIHGTPEPENVGRTESHGCFRLANWDVLTLVRYVHVGMKVLVVE